MTSAPHDIRTYPPAGESQEDQIELADLFAVLIGSRWLIAITAVVFVLLGMAYIFIATPIYSADALIQIEEKKSGLGDLDINALFEGDTSVNAEIEILRSRMVLGTVVDNLQLDIKAEPRYFPILGRAFARRSSQSSRLEIRVDTLDVPEALTGVDLVLVGSQTGRYELLGPDGVGLLSGKVGEVASASFFGEPVSVFVSVLRAADGDEFRVRRQPRLSAIEDIQRHLNIVEKGKNSGILSISLEGTDPVSVSQQLNEIANVYVRKDVERRSAEAEKTLEFLDKQLPAVKTDMETAEAALNSYRLEKGSVDLPLETQSILETIVTVEAKLNELLRERERVIQSFTPAHPMVVALDRQIDSLRGDIVELNDQVRELPNTQQEVLRLVRDAEVNTQLYTALLNTSQELRVVKAGTVGNVRVVDNAIPPYEPIRPKSALVLVSSLVLGVLMGVIISFIRKAVDGGVEDPSVIESRLNIPVYATVPHSKRQDRLSRKLESRDAKPAILAMDSPEDIAVESLRNLRTALHFGTMEAKNNCIMIAGPSPEIGKSFVSVNLAVVLASNDKKVLLIDGDMRRGQLHRYLGLKRDNGLSDFISGEIPIGGALHPSTIKGLTFIPTGKIPPNPAELLLHQRFTNCLNALTPRFDHIIIDSPPVLAVTDATVIGQMAGATLMVLKSGEHPLREIELSVKRLRQTGVNLRGFLINDMNMQSQRYGTGRYSYQYHYGNR